MGVSKPVDLGSVTFSMRKEATAYFSEMLSRYSVGAEVLPADALHLGELLLRHICCDEIIGCGVDSFTTIISDEGSKCFAVLRDDGSVCGFSFHKCISNS